MFVRTLCPICRKTFKVSREHLGKRTNCKACGNRFTVAEVETVPRDDGESVVSVVLTFAYQCATAFLGWVRAHWIPITFLALALATSMIGARFIAKSGVTPKDLQVIWTGLLSLLVVLAYLAAALAIYFAPTINAAKRRHPNFNPIFIVNLFLGWTLIGWVVALAWSATAFKEE